MGISGYVVHSSGNILVQRTLIQNCTYLNANNYPPVSSMLWGLARLEVIDCVFSEFVDYSGWYTANQDVIPFAYSPDLIISGCVFENMNLNTQVIAKVDSNSNTTIINSIIRNIVYTAFYSTPFISNSGGILTMTNTTVENVNVIGIESKLFESYQGSISNCTFANNYQTSYNLVSVFAGTVTRSIWQNNTVERGAALALIGSTEIFVDGCSFIGNRMGTSGAIASNKQGCKVAAITNSLFLENFSFSNGPAIFNSMGNLLISNSTFISNSGRVGYQGSIATSNDQFALCQYDLTNVNLVNITSSSSQVTLLGNNIFSNNQPMEAGGTLLFAEGQYKAGENITLSISPVDYCNSSIRPSVLSTNRFYVALSNHPAPSKTIVTNSTTFTPEFNGTLELYCPHEMIIVAVKNASISELRKQ